jgi:hypothetical protein
MSNLHANAIASAQTLVTTAETVVGTITQFAVNNPQGEGVFIGGEFNITTGTGTTALSVRIRQGSLTGTTVGAARVHTIGAGVSGNIGFSELDASAYGLANSSAVYVVTVSQTGASANGTVNGGAITAQSAVVSE